MGGLGQDGERLILVSLAPHTQLPNGCGHLRHAAVVNFSNFFATILETNIMTRVRFCVCVCVCGCVGGVCRRVCEGGGCRRVLMGCAINHAFIIMDIFSVTI